MWVISQRYISVLKDLREQTKWDCMFNTKDRDSFENCLRENYVIPTLEEKQQTKTNFPKLNTENEYLKLTNLLIIGSLIDFFVIIACSRIAMLITKIAILKARIAMLVAKIIIYISENSANSWVIQQYL